MIPALFCHKMYSSSLCLFYQPNTHLFITTKTSLSSHFQIYFTTPQNDFWGDIYREICSVNLFTERWDIGSILAKIRPSPDTIPPATLEAGSVITFSRNRRTGKSSETSPSIYYTTPPKRVKKNHTDALGSRTHKRTWFHCILLVSASSSGIYG